MREKIVTSRERFFHHLRLLALVVFLILANVIWAPEGLSLPPWAKDRIAKKSAQIWIYAASSDNPDTCGTNMKLFLGTIYVDVDNSNVVTPTPDEVCVLQAGGLHPRQAIKSPNLKEYCVNGVVVFTQPWCMFCDGKDNGDGWYLKILTDQWWKSQRTDTTTSYCGVVEFDDYSKFPYTDSRIKKPWLSWNDREKLRGVIITDWPASLKLTVTGRQVKIEPLHACYAPTGKCIKDRLLWESEPCPRFTTSAGKGSSCQDPVPVPVPVEGQDTEDSEHRVCCVDGSCQLATVDSCKGTFMPDKTSCTPNPCARAMNGCCLNGKCVALPPTECGDRCGEPLNRPCSGNFEADCGSLTGACMVGTNCEPFQTECSCVQYLSGKYQGNGTRCPPTPQLPTPQVPKGACCFDGECNLETQADCSKKGDGAVFLSGKTCDPNPCQQPEPPKGGCCDVLGKCTENVTAADCLLQPDARFFPDGCPDTGTCPPVEGACYVPCALSPNVMDCSTVSIRECVAKNNARFEPNKKCPDIKTCENCGPCEQAYATGEWFLTLQDEKGKLTLLSDCKATMIMEKLGGDRATNLPIAQSPIIRREGIWYCSGENVIVDFDGEKTTLVINKERATPRLCYRDGGKLICAERKPRPDEVLVVISVEGNGASPDWAGKSFVQSGSHEEVFRLKRGQDLKTELEAYHKRLLGDVCEVITPPGMISKDAPPQIFNWAEITVLTGPITDVKQLEGRTLKNTWKTINENGISLGELRKRGGCGN